MVKKIFSTRILQLLFAVLLTASCGSRKEVAYFQNAKEFETVVNTETFSTRFKVDDIVSINVSVLDAEVAKPFNLVRGTSELGRPEELDYLIDKDGNIDFPVIGKVRLQGLTPEEGKQLLREKLADFLKDPIINIRIKNFRITVLGEVGRPGTFTVTSERITILEAIGLAGDLRIKGRRDNIMVLRDFNGAKTITKVDLTSKELINSPVFYLTQNDVVYVEPNKSAIRTASLDNSTSIIVSIFSTLLTSAIILITRN